MTDFYLKFASEEEARTVLYTVTPAVLSEEGEVVTEEQVKPNYMNIDVLGVIYEPTAEVDADGYPVMAPLDGWHVNVRVIDEDATNLEPFRVEPEPSTPARVWA